MLKIFVRKLFAHIESPEAKEYEFTLTVSFLEIYNEKVCMLAIIKELFKL